LPATGESTQSVNQAEPAPAGASPSTLPGRYYYDPDVYQRERDRIFYRTWQYVGHVSMLAEGPCYLVRDIADESIIVLKDRQGELRAFYNVCQHRAHRLLEGEGPLKPVITCPYHTWAYDHEGQLRSARGTENIDEFDKGAIRLKSVKLETLCGFLFVNLDDGAKSIRELMPGLEQEFRSFSPSPEKLTVAKRYDIPLKANWKNSVENFSECYHCPNQHRTLTKNALDLKTYKIECYPYFHVHRSRDRGDQVGYHIDPGAAPRSNEFRSFYVWPNTVFEVYPGGNLTVFHHAPVGPEGTLQGVEWYFPSAELSEDEQAVIDFVHTVRLEDVPLCESVQKGLRSRGYGRGRLVLDPGQTDMRGWCRKVGGKLENWRKLLIVKPSERRCAAAERSLRHGTSYSIVVAGSIFR
jgi:choline monooxygenase